MDLARSAVAIPVRLGAPLPDLSTEASLRQAVLAADRVGYSTGPSGTALLKLFDGWRITDEIRPRLMQAPPGVPVGALVASGAVTLGFQQLSELLGIPGITVAGTMPAPVQIVTIFSAGVPVVVAADSHKAAQVAELLAYMTSPQVAEAVRRHGMEPA